MFKAFDAAPTSINFSEVYSALQTKVVEGQENPLAHHRRRQALRGAEISARMTNHMWDGFWFLANGKRLERLPADVREVIAKQRQRLRPRPARRHRQAERHAAEAT